MVSIHNTAPYLSLCIGDQLSCGSLQVRQGVPKHLRPSDGSHGCCCCYLAGQWIQLLGAEKSLINLPTFRSIKQKPHTLRLIAMARPDQANRSLVCAVQCKREVLFIIQLPQVCAPEPNGKGNRGLGGMV